MYSADECFRMMDLPDYYGGPRLYQTDYSRPFTPQPPPRTITPELRRELGRRIEAWKAEVRQRIPQMMQENREAAYRRTECVRPANADELIGDIIAILEDNDE